MSENAPCDILQLLKESGTVLTRVGNRYRCRCPFPDHEDVHPSFYLTETNEFKCFGCGRSGGPNNFLYWINIANGAQNNPIEQSLSVSEPFLQKVMERVVGYYESRLPEATRARVYLQKRGLWNEEQIKHFRIGYADSTLLPRVAPGSKTWAALKALGLVTKKTEREFFNGCITIPIFDPETEHVVKIYGRRRCDQVTGNHLYLPGPHRGVWNPAGVKSAVTDELMVVESILDALACWNAGFKNVLALFGTNGLTEDHLELLRRYPPSKIVLVLDGDEGGRKAVAPLAEKFSEIANVFLAELPEEEDPASYLQKNSREQFAAILNTAKGVKSQYERG